MRHACSAMFLLFLFGAAALGGEAMHSRESALRIPQRSAGRRRGRAPRLSWTLQSDRRGQRQTAYQVLVASSPELLGKQQGDLWDSGRVASDETAQVAYAGKPLGSRQACFWKVRAWDRDGKPSDWSQAGPLGNGPAAGRRLDGPLDRAPT